LQSFFQKKALTWCERTG